MKFQPRKNIRLEKYDYSQSGGYYITICTAEHKHTLSRIHENGIPVVQLTTLGEIAERTLIQLESRYPIKVDAYVIMPNHIHMILMLEDPDLRPKIGQVVGAYKSLVTKYWRDYCETQEICSGKIWQRNYYEHILRNHTDYLEKALYMQGNPARWIMKTEK